MIHTQSARESLEAYCGDFVQDFDLEKAFELLYSYVGESHDWVEPTDADIVEVLQSCDISGRQ